ncbi:MAG TPA: NUDIX domain-containing protein [Acetobacteraceae bacterium]|nr:NUDIX domain-containing protein [Acetobacteraceae bacterium]
MQALMRHVEACHNAVLPGGRLRLRLGADPIGWVRPDLAAEIERLGGSREGAAVCIADAASFERITAALTKAGHLWHRGERFDVRADPGGPNAGRVLATVDRGALPTLGIQADGVHVNGLVRRGDRLFLWVARRAADKAMDPGKLDHLVAGGVPAGLTAAETLVKEAQEEAGIPPALARTARLATTLSYAMDRPEGLRRDRLDCYDLDLPDSFQPVPVDGEVAGFELWPLSRALATVRDTDDFKFNVSLVLIDLFLRSALIDPATPHGRRLRAALDRD